MEVFGRFETAGQFDGHGVRLLLCQKRIQLKKRLQMTALTNQIRFQIAEKSAGSLNS
jgi:hypothetical protein